MQGHTLERLLADIKRATDGLIRSPDEPDGALPSARFAALVEEVEVAAEELRERNEELIRDRHALDEERARYRSLFDTAPAGYVETDPNGVVMEANRTAAEMIGVVAEHLRGKPLSVYVAPSDRRTFRRMLAAAGDGMAIRALEIRVEPRHRRPFFVAFEGIPVSDPSGATVSVRWLITDITERKLADALQRDRETRLRLMLSQMPAIVWTTDGDLRFTSLEGRALAPLDLDAGDLIGEPLFDHFDAGLTGPAPVDAHRRALGGGSVAYEMRLRDRVFQCHVEPLRGVDDQIAGCVGVAHDVTERRRAERDLAEREARLRVLLDQVPAVIWTTDSELRFTSAQGSGMATVGLRAGDLVGSTLMAFLGTDDPSCLPMGAHLVALKGERAGYEIDWEGHPHRVWVEPLIDPGGSIVGCVGLALDVTEDKRVRDALQVALEAERRASEELRTIDEMKDLLLAALSHDIRSPISAIMGLAATLERLPSLDSEDARAMLGRIVENSVKMEHMVRDILDLDRLDKQVLEPQRETTDVAALVRHVIGGMDPDREVTVEGAPALVAEIDRAKVERIVENLLANAVKHSGPGAPVSVGLRAEGRGVLLTVEDAGPGVPDEMKEVIFRPFSRGHDPAAPGLGLGLTIVARFAELHGGRAWVEDRLGGGAAFKVLLPGPSDGDPHGGPGPASEGS